MFLRCELQTFPRHWSYKRNKALQRACLPLYYGTYSAEDFALAKVATIEQTAKIRVLGLDGTPAVNGVTN